MGTLVYKIAKPDDHVDQHGYRIGFGMRVYRANAGTRYSLQGLLSQNGIVRVDGLKPRVRDGLIQQVLNTPPGGPVVIEALLASVSAGRYVDDPRACYELD
jgi:hypothetical protein